jgi:hypothetical protein
MIHFYMDRREFLGCAVDGFEWRYLTVEGSMFLLMHMACICLQAIMIEKVFYGIPKEHGVYEINYDEDDVDSEPPSPVFIKKKKKVIEFDSDSNRSKDDNFTRSAR